MAWPSGLRRQIKALVRKGEGSNPSVIKSFYVIILTLKWWKIQMIKQINHYLQHKTKKL